MQRGLFMGGGKRPRSRRAALLAEHEPQLLRWLQLSLVGTEGGAGLGQIESAEKVAPEVTFLAAQLPRGSLALFSWHLPCPHPLVGI
jgi:hypothetical protein